MSNTWYIIYNPISGGGNAEKKINSIQNLFIYNKIKTETVRTQYPHHEEELVQKAIKKGYNKFICIGGDGTIHHMVNGIMKQNYADTRSIKLAVIPTGTGNDWVKNYKISTNFKKAIDIILRNNSLFQDIGKITLSQPHKEVYFNNAAGIGFDAYVVKNINQYKNLGSLAYLFAALFSFKTYNSGKFIFSLDHKKIESNLFLISLGICKYSGAGMQLTDYKNHKPGYFDVTLIKPISLFKVIINITKLYNGRINQIKETHCSQVKDFTLMDNTVSYIQADGELIGKGDADITLITRAIQFIVP